MNNKLADINKTLLMGPGPSSVSPSVYKALSTYTVGHLDKRFLDIMDDVIFLNGDFISKSDAQISIMDRGFLFGDGVYELIPIYNGKTFLIDKHLSRLGNSLKLINMKNDYAEIVNIKGTIEHLIKTNNHLIQSLYFTTSYNMCQHTS